MPTPLYPPQRPLSIGEIVDAAFRIFLATVVKCLPYALVAVVAEQLPNIYYIVTGRGVLLAMFTAVKDPRWLLFDGIGLAIAMFLCSAMLLRQRALVTGGAAALAPELTAVLRRAPALMLLVVLWVAVVLACLLPALAFGQPLNIVVAIVMLVPASFIMLALCASWPSLILTGRSAAASLVHSWHLTSGSLWRLSAVFTVAIVLVFVLELLITVVTGLISLLVAHGDVAIIMAATETVLVILHAIVMPFYTALLLAVFGDLCVRKEGTDLAQRISVAAAG
ncbi:MAG TPA: hypothetical protein VN882_06735 [Steroidobacteraceae bacterium]|nr:hypothetical protein [Steroidobacteraceae bacterium]